MASKFGPQFDQIWPTVIPKLTEFGQKLLSDCVSIEKPAPLKLEQIIRQSHQFPVQFPIDTCRIFTQPEERKPIIEEQAASVYPVIHERVLWLYLRFLEHKKVYGTPIEKVIYSGISVIGLVQRLLSNRCIVFVGSYDKFMLIGGETGAEGFEQIGTENEKWPLVLKDCLSYDEMKLSAFLSISSYTEFINDGTRMNCGAVELNKSKIETSGIVIGLIGSRLARRNQMEFQELIINDTQNRSENGYGKQQLNAAKSGNIFKACLSPTSKNSKSEHKFNYRQMWNEFYNESGFHYKEVKPDGERFGWSSRGKDLFDNVAMKKRFTISFDTLLLESEARAASANKRAYIHVVGIGLGVWCVAPQQEEVFLATFSQRIEALKDQLNHVSFIHFSWFMMTECGKIKNENVFESETHPDGGIQVFMSKRDPAEKLSLPKFENTLLIVTYAWDSNSLPGNEFWMGNLWTSSDPAAACSTLITELHNPHINTTMVSGSNLHIASPDHGVIHISEYAKQFVN